MAQYESELTGFLRSLKQHNPDLERQQREGRAIWWETHHDADDLARWQLAQPRRGSYVYYSDDEQRPARSPR